MRIKNLLVARNQTAELRSTNQISFQGLLNLLIVYIVWGSTYLAIRVALQGDSGFSPYILAGTRVLASGGILIAWGALCGKKLKPSRSELTTIVISGLLLWVGGIGSLTWAEQRIESGMASLLVAVIPIWVAVIESIVDRKMPDARLVAALLVGFGGTAILIIPTISAGETADLFSILLLGIAGFSWGAGSFYQSRRPIELSPEVSAGYQQLFGAVGLSILVLLKGESWSFPNLDNWLAWGYLVLFGSVIGFTAYVKTLKLVPVKIASTHAYVNPVIAVFLGWLILGESVTIWIILGSLLIFLGVAGVYKSQELDEPASAHFRK